MVESFILVALHQTFKLEVWRCTNTVENSLPDPRELQRKSQKRSELEGSPGHPKDGKRRWARPVMTSTIVQVNFALPSLDFCSPLSGPASAL